MNAVRKAPVARKSAGTPDDIDHSGTEPSGAAAGLDAYSGDFSPYVWQQLSEIQRSLGAIQATLQQHTSAIDKVDEKLSSKTDKLEERLGGKLSKIESDVSEFKQIRHTAKVLAVVIGITAAGMLTITGFIAKEVWSVIKPHAISAVQQPSTPQPAQKP